MLHLPALWYFDTLVIYPQWFRRVKFVVIPPCFVYQQYLWNIAIQPVVGCYNSWANLQCLSCSLLGEKCLWNGTITIIKLQSDLALTNDTPHLALTGELWDFLEEKWPWYIESALYWNGFQYPPFIPLLGASQHHLWYIDCSMQSSHRWLLMG